MLEPWPLHLAEHGRRRGHQALPEVLAYFGQLSRQVNRWFESLDVILSPVLSSAPPQLVWLAPT